MLLQIFVKNKSTLQHVSTSMPSSFGTVCPYPPLIFKSLLQIRGTSFYPELRLAFDKGLFPWNDYKPLNGFHFNAFYRGSQSQLVLYSFHESWSWSQCKSNIFNQNVLTWFNLGLLEPVCGLMWGGGIISSGNAPLPLLLISALNLTFSSRGHFKYNFSPWQPLNNIFYCQRQNLIGNW